MRHSRREIARRWNAEKIVGALADRLEAGLGIATVDLMLAGEHELIAAIDVVLGDPSAARRRARSLLRFRGSTAGFGAPTFTTRTRTSSAQQIHDAIERKLAAGRKPAPPLVANRGATDRMDALDKRWTRFAAACSRAIREQSPPPLTFYTYPVAAVRAGRVDLVRATRGHLVELLERRAGLLRRAVVGPEHHAFAKLVEALRSANAAVSPELQRTAKAWQNGRRGGRR